MQDPRSFPIELRDQHIQIVVSADRSRLWVNNHERCILRVHEMRSLEVDGITYETSDS